MTVPPESNAMPLPVPGVMASFSYLLLVVMAVLFDLSLKRYKLFPTILGVCIGLQVLTLVGVPIAVLLLRWHNHGKAEPAFSSNDVLSWLPSKSTIFGYLALAISVYAARSTLHELQLLQASAACEALAFWILVIHLIQEGTTSLLSVKKMLLDGARLASRLVASILLEESLPRMARDDAVHGCYAFSIVAIGILLSGTTFMNSAQQHHSDTCQISWFFVGASMLAMPLRVSISGQIFPDTLWMWASCLDAVAVAPQLWLVARHGGVANKMISHHLALMVTSRLLTLAFWWEIRTTWRQGESPLGWSMLAIMLVPLILLSHFMCYYFKNLWSHGLLSSVPVVCSP